MVISTLYPAISDDNEISPYCASAGVTVSKITSDEPLHVVDKFLTNKLVYDLEKYCRKITFLCHRQ